MNGPVFIVAGGTGGHLYPGIALAEALTKRGQPVEFVARRGDLGRAVLSRDKFIVHELTGQGFPRAMSLKAAAFPVKLLIGQGQAFALLQRRAPSVVVGMGGYLSFPVVLAAHLLNIRTLIHEQNVVPGLANRALAYFVDSIAVSFQASVEHFPASRTHVSGLPVRHDIGTVTRSEARQVFGLSADRPTFLVFGGSLGAHRLNQMLPDACRQLPKDAFQIVHITGEKDFPETQQAYKVRSIKAVVMPYCHTMPAAYAAADWVISRSGASTIAELLMARRPALLIPFPFASADHQLYNAQVLANAGLAEILLDREASDSRIAECMNQRLTKSPPPDPDFAQLASTSHTADAAERLAQEVEVMMGRNL